VYSNLDYENELSNKIIGCAIEVHRELGPGLLENAYKECLAFELKKEGLNIEVEKPIPLFYREIKIDCGYRADIIVEDTVILELKSVDELNNIHLAQVLTYLRLAECSLGLLINFNVKLLKEGIKRVVL
jgi:GxxExxY protein